MTSDQEQRLREISLVIYNKQEEFLGDKFLSTPFCLAGVEFAIIDRKPTVYSSPLFKVGIYPANGKDSLDVVVVFNDDNALSFPFYEEKDVNTKRTHTTFVKQGRKKNHDPVNLTQEENNHVDFIVKGNYRLLRDKIDKHGFVSIESELTPDNKFMFLTVKTGDTNPVKVTIPLIEFSTKNAKLIRLHLISELTQFIPINSIPVSIFCEWFGVAHTTITKDLKDMGIIAKA